MFIFSDTQNGRPEVILNQNRDYWYVNFHRNYWSSCRVLRVIPLKIITAVRAFWKRMPDLRWLSFGNHGQLIAFQVKYLFFMLDWRSRFSKQLDYQRWQHLVTLSSDFNQCTCNDFGIIGLLQCHKKIGNMCLICLKMIVVAVWIVCMSVEYLRIWSKNGEMAAVWKWSL